MTTVDASIIPLSVNYTSRDYYTLRAELISRIQDRIPTWTAADPSDFGLALVEAFAYMGDIMSYYIDRTANENFLLTAVQRSSILNIASTYGYIPTGYKNASTTVTFTNSSASSVTLPVGTVVSADITFTVNNKPSILKTYYFTTSEQVVVPAKSGSINGTVDVYATEGVYVTEVSTTANTKGELLGYSDKTPNQTFEIPNTPVVDRSFDVYVQEGDLFTRWTEVTHIIDYGPKDNVYSVIYDEFNTAYILFGDGISGRIPVLHSEIRAMYVVGGGGDGNIAAGSITNLYSVPGLTKQQVTALSSTIKVVNASAATGGADPETNDDIRFSAPRALRALNRAVTLDDYASLAISAGAGKAQAKAVTWSSVTLYIAPTRDATDSDPAPGLLPDESGPTTSFNQLASVVDTYLSDKVMIGTTVTIQPPTYVDVVLSVKYVKLNGYTTTDIEKNIKSAITDAFGYYNAIFKDTIYPQDIEYQLQQIVDGLKTVKLISLHREVDSGLQTLVGDESEIFRFKEENISVSAL